MQQLIRIIEPPVIASGSFPSILPNQLAMWRDSLNVLFYDGRASKISGLDVMGTAVEPVTQMAQALVDGQKRIYLATEDKLIAVTDGVPNQLAAGYAGGRWSLVPWGTWLVATNDVDKVQVWKNTGAAVDLANVPVNRARIVRKVSNFLIIFYGQEVAWPDLANIENWTIAPETRAGNMFLRDLDSDIEAVEPFADGLAYYTQNMVGYMSFVGGTSVFGFKTMLSGIGAIGRNAVVNTGKMHYGLGRNGIWMTDLSGSDYIDQPAVNAYIDNDIDWLYARDVRSFHYADLSTVAWFWRAVGGNTHGIAYNYKTKAWAPLALDVTASLTQEVYDRPLLAFGTTYGQLGAEPDIDGDPIPTSLRTVPLDAGDPTAYKRWGLVRTFRTGEGAMQIRVGYSDEEDAEPDWSAWATLERNTWIDRESVYITIEYRSTVADVDWAIGGFEVHGEPTGALQ